MPDSRLFDAHHSADLIQHPHDLTFPSQSSLLPIRRIGLYRLFELLQIFCFSAAFIKSSLKSGCARDMMRSARSHVVRPTRF